MAKKNNENLNNKNQSAQQSNNRNQSKDKSKHKGFQYKKGGKQGFKSRNGSAKKYRKPVDETPVKIAFLGGLNEVGKNMTIYEYKDEMFLVDCGLAFPG